MAWIRFFSIFLFILLTFFLFQFADDYYEHEILVITNPYPHNQIAGETLAKKDSKSNDDHFTFAVIGDINGEIENFEKILENLNENKSIDFLILLGDCAAKPNEKSHQYFRAEFIEHARDNNFPTFITAGNHDVSEKAKYTIRFSDFEKMYGPANYAFIYKKTLFIILGKAVLWNNPTYKEESLAFLKETIKKYKGQYFRSFLFTHISPLLPKINSDDIIQKELVDFVDKNKIDYVISGHEHRYARIQRGECDYIIAGTGGAKMRDRDGDHFQNSGKLHCFLTFTVHGKSINELLFKVEPENLFIRICAPLEYFNVSFVIPHMFIIIPIILTLWGTSLIMIFISFSLKRGKKIKV